MNLSDLIALSAPVEVHSERCIHQFSPKASCARCMQVCPSGSIQLRNGQIEVETCDGCGRCIQACPHDVFTMDFPEILAVPPEGPLVIACRKHDFSDMPVFSTGCLQQFTWLQLAMLVHRFGEVVLFADEETCSACTYDWFPKGQTVLMQRYGLTAYEEKLHIIREKEAMNDYLQTHFGDINTRREYMKKQLETVKYAAKQYTKRSMNGYLDAFRETVQSKQALCFEKTQSQTLVLHELYEAMSKREDEAVIPLQALAATRCRFCRTCEKLCPWQAVAIVEEEGKAVLAHHDVLCARCGVCVDLCPEHGLHWEHGLTVADIATPHWRALAEGTAVVCEYCGEWFYPTEKGQTTCVICRNKY